MEYLIILFLFALLGVILEKIHHIHLYQNRKERILVTGVFFIFGTLWDSFAIWRGHWLFPENGTLGIKIGLMPLEEYLFMLILPYSILTVYTVIHQKYDNPVKRFIRKLLEK